MIKEIEVYSDDTPLAGENKPPHPEKIDDLIKLLATISHRFGNTRIAFRLKWGAAALNDPELKNDRVQWCSDMTDKLHDLCLNQGVNEVPTWHEINDLLSGNPPPREQ